MHPMLPARRLRDMARGFAIPATMSLGAAVLLGLGPREARAQSCVAEDCQPPSGSAYAGAFHFTYSAGFTADIGNPNLHSFTTCTGLPASSPGAFATHTFDAVMDFTLSMNGGPVVPTTAPAHVTSFDRFNHVSGPTRFFDTEMIQLDISGGSLPAGTRIRESPTLASTGATSVQDLGGGSFRIDSFFDVFTELSIDTGLTWVPCATCPGHMTLSGPGCPTPSRSGSWGHVKLIYR